MLANFVSPCGNWRKEKHETRSFDRHLMLGATLLASAQTSFFYPHVVDGVWEARLENNFFLTNPSSATATERHHFHAKTITTSCGRCAWQITLADETESRRPRNVFTFTLPGASRRYVSSATGGFVSGFASVTTNPRTVSGTAIFSGI